MKEDGKNHMIGRGEFVRLMFEVTGTPYIDHGRQPDNGKKVIAMMRSNGGNTTDMPCFAPPIIRRGSFVLNQTPTIVRFLGKQYGLYPSKWEDEAHCDSLMSFLTDFVAEGRLVFHAMGFTTSYYQQVEETKGHIKWFEETRMPAFLKYLETVLVHN